MRAAKRSRKASGGYSDSGGSDDEPAAAPGEKSYKNRPRRKATEKPQGADQIRQAFSKRKKGLVLKSFQLSRLTEAKVFVFIMNEKGSSWAYSTPGFGEPLEKKHLAQLRSWAGVRNGPKDSTEWMSHPADAKDTPDNREDFAGTNDAEARRMKATAKGSQAQKLEATRLQSRQLAQQQAEAEAHAQAQERSRNTPLDDYRAGVPSMPTLSAHDLYAGRHVGGMHENGDTPCHSGSSDPPPAIPFADLVSMTGRLANSGGGNQALAAAAASAGDNGDGHQGGDSRSHHLAELMRGIPGSGGGGAPLNLSCPPHLKAINTKPSERDAMMEGAMGASGAPTSPSKLGGLSPASLAGAAASLSGGQAISLHDMLSTPQSPLFSVFSQLLGETPHGFDGMSAPASPSEVAAMYNAAVAAHNGAGSSAAEEARGELSEFLRKNPSLAAAHTPDGLSMLGDSGLFAELLAGSPRQGGPIENLGAAAAGTHFYQDAGHEGLNGAALQQSGSGAGGVGEPGPGPSAMQGLEGAEGRRGGMGGPGPSTSGGGRPGGGGGAQSMAAQPANGQMGAGTGNGRVQVGNGAQKGGPPKIRTAGKSRLANVTSSSTAAQWGEDGGGGGMPGEGGSGGGATGNGNGQPSSATPFPPELFAYLQGMNKLKTEPPTPDHASKQPVECDEDMP